MQKVGPPNNREEGLIADLDQKDALTIVIPTGVVFSEETAKHWAGGTR